MLSSTRAFVLLALALPAFVSAQTQSPKFGPCTNSSDCFDSGSGCFNPTGNVGAGTCLAIGYSGTLVTIYAFVMGGVALLLSFHVFWEVRKRCKAWNSNRKRANKKAKQAAKKNENYDALEAIALGSPRQSDEALASAGEGKRQKFLGKLISLYSLSKAHIGMVRQGASVRNINTTLLHEERAVAATRLRTLTHIMLDRGTMDTMSEDDVEAVILMLVDAEVLVGSALWKPDDVPRAGQELVEAESIMDRAAARLSATSSSADMVLGKPLTEALQWEMSDARLTELQLRVELSLEHTEEAARAKAERVMLANTSFVSARNVWKLANQRSKLRNCLTSTYTTLTPSFVRTYPIFYFLFFGGMFIIFIRFFDQVGRAKSNLDVQNAGLLGGTFLPVPPYYNLRDHENQRTLIPLLYAIMHSAMYCFGWLPVCFMRGVWRDVANAFPRLRRWIPIDDMVYFHKLLGVMILTFILSGGVIWMAALGQSCRRDDDPQSCLAFDSPAVPGADQRTFDFNPFVNVLALRKTVFLTWFPILPLLHWTKGPPPKHLPFAFMHTYWYEFAYYSHCFVAVLSFITAQICRFEVFYLTLIPWCLYFLDKIREIVFHSYGSYIVVRPTFSSQEDSAEECTSLIHTDDNEVPTSVKLLIDVPPGFKSQAGQHIYIMVPEISRMQWHPFSLASGSADNYVELQIGVIANKDDWRERNESKLTAYMDKLRKFDATKGGRIDDDESGWCCCSRKKPVAPGALAVPDARIPPPKWVMVNRTTWTYQLQHILRDRIARLSFLEDPDRQADEVPPIRCYIRGPYGSTFKDCFDPHYTGVVIIGAGTGLTAALSVLRELIQRKKAGKRAPKYVWFVWSCRRVDDLLWCWEILHKLLLSAIEDRVLQPGKNWNRKSNMCDWIGVTIYVTQANKKKLAEFLKRAPQISNTHSVGRLLSFHGDDDHSNEVSDPSISLAAPAAKEVVSDVDEASVSRSNPRGSIGEGANAGFFATNDDDEKEASLSMAADGDKDTHVDVDGKRKTVIHRFKSLGIGVNSKKTRKQRLSEELQNWLGYDRHLLASSLDDPDTHINKLLAWARVYVDRKAGKNRKMSVSFCGPTGLAHTIAAAARKIGSGAEFSADHQ